VRGASNQLPTDEGLAAFADRFLVRVFVSPVSDPALENLLREGWSLGQQEVNAAALGDLDDLAHAARQCDLTHLRPLLADAVRSLRGAGIELSDRRAVRAQRLCAAAAVMAGRNTASRADLWPLVFAVPGADGQRLARGALAPLLTSSQSETLPAAAAEASLGPLARAARVVEAGDAVLAGRPSDPEASFAWRLKLEGVAREIDAGFDPARLPPELAALRARLVAALET
jgi:MoxR-like ATPase